MSSELLERLDRLHTTPMGAERVRNNLGLGEVEVAAWCRERIAAPGTVIIRRGKNWYAEAEGCRITVNAGSMTIITAHKRPAWRIRALREEEYPLLEDFLYEAIFLPEGAEAPPRSILRRPELRVYVDGFGTRRDDHALAAEVGGKVVGVVWARIMEDYGHIDDETPSLAIALYPDCRGQGIGTALLREMLALLKQCGYRRVSLSVQKANRAGRLYRRVGFEAVAETGEEYIMAVRL